MSSVASSIREWWSRRSRGVYLPLPTTASDPDVSPSNPPQALASPSTTGPRSFKLGPIKMKPRSFIAILLSSLCLNGFYTYNVLAPSKPTYSSADVCPAPLPNFFSTHPPSTHHPKIHNAVKSFNRELAEFYESTKNTEGQLDSVAVAVVTPNGSLLETFHGLLNANTSLSSPPVNRDTIYRIASISKLFTALETFILREKGALRLDDPVSRFMDTTEHPRLGIVTIRELLSHMSGIGRDWPPGNATEGHWPDTIDGRGPPPYSGIPLPNREVLLGALENNEWVTPPYIYPVYSNTGFNILGLVNLFADKLHENRTKELTHAELLENDIFRPLGFSGTTFHVTDEYRDRAAVSSSQPWETTWDSGVYSPGGGQSSSLSDMVLLAKALMNSMVHDDLLSPVVMREWLRPLYNEWDGFTSVGMPWEIRRQKFISDASDTKPKMIELYRKGGALESHYSTFALIPTHSISIIVLTTGKMSRVDEITQLAIRHLMPAIDDALGEEVCLQLGGRWVNTDTDEPIILNLAVIDGGLYAVDYNIDEKDALETIQEGPTRKMPVWPSGGNHYRLIPSTTTYDECLFHWSAVDGFPYANGAPVNLLNLSNYSPESPMSNVLSIPSMQVNLTRREVKASC